MYRYEYESVEFTLGEWDFGSGNTYGLRPNHREIIDARAKDGWRFVGCIPVGQRTNGPAVNRLDLIFEKKCEVFAL